MDVSEAAATNVLLRAVLGMAGPEGVPISDDDAARAARFLAERAHRALAGGLEGAVVATRWPGRRCDGDERLCDVCRHRRMSPLEDVLVTTGAL